LDIEIGPQNPKDAPFLAHMRYQQSWYRAAVLQVPCGVGPRRSNSSRYGNMLRWEDGQRGLNFLTAHIFQIARRRVAQRAWPLDDFRLYCNLLNPQSMAFNLFAPLVDDSELAQTLFQPLLPADVQTVKRVQMVYAPPPAVTRLSDPLPFDALVEFQQSGGRPGLLAVVARLADPPAAPTLNATPVHLQWTRRPDAPWLPEAEAQLAAPQLAQLWREHLLLEALAANTAADAWLAVVHHPANEESSAALSAYRACLRPQHNLLDWNLAALLENWRPLLQTEKQARWLDDFELRYLQLAAARQAEEPPHGSHPL